MFHLQKTREKVGNPPCAAAERGSYREMLIADKAAACRAVLGGADS